jgi:EpsI family protein
MTASLRFTGTLVLLAGTLVLARFSALRNSQPLARPLTAIPARLEPWIGVDDTPLPNTIQASLAASSYLTRTYRYGPREMNLFIAYYANQRAGESMHSPKYCMPGGGWELMDTGNAEVISDGRRFSINNYTLYKSGERMRMLYWYQGRYRVIASEYRMKLYLLWDAARTGQTSGSIVRITAGADPDSLAQALQLAARIIPEVSRCFGREYPGA